MTPPFMPRFCSKCPCHHVPATSPIDFCDVCADDDGRHWVASKSIPTSCGTVSITVSESGVNAWWLQLDLETKLEVFAAHLESSLTGSGSGL